MINWLPTDEIILLICNKPPAQRATNIVHNASIEAFLSFFYYFAWKLYISALQEENPFQQCVKLVAAHPLIRCGTDKNE